MEIDLDALTRSTLREEVRTNYIEFDGVFLPEEYKFLIKRSKISKYTMMIFMSVAFKNPERPGLKRWSGVSQTISILN